MVHFSNHSSDVKLQGCSSEKILDKSMLASKISFQFKLKSFPLVKGQFPTRLKPVFKLQHVHFTTFMKHKICTLDTKLSEQTDIH